MMRAKLRNKRKVRDDRFRLLRLHTYRFVIAGNDITFMRLLNKPKRALIAALIIFLITGFYFLYHSNYQRLEVDGNCEHRIYFREP